MKGRFSDVKFGKQICQQMFAPTFNQMLLFSMSSIHHSNNMGCEWKTGWKTGHAGPILSIVVTGKHLPLILVVFGLKDSVLSAI